MSYISDKKSCIFLVKKRNLDCERSYSYNSSGLYNSSNFISDMLNISGNKICSSVIEVVDSNSIDKIVSDLNPNIVFIEALWVTPTKLKELMNLHPKTKWVVRIHSNTPFISNEGVAIDWCMKYLKLGATIAPNCYKMVNEFKSILFDNKNNIVYLPNYYNCYNNYNSYFDDKNESDILEVACFGAIRPLKNQLIQAMAAVELAKRMDKKLNFHINSSRVENNGGNVLKNITGLFENLSSDYNLIQHEWLEHNKFLELVKKMDIGMQVSLSETFNIVTADFVSNRIPVVVSSEIDWVCNFVSANPTSINDIVHKMEIALNYDIITKFNLMNLKRYNKKSSNTWLKYLKNI